MDKVAASSGEPIKKLKGPGFEGARKGEGRH